MMKPRDLVWMAVGVVVLLVVGSLWLKQREAAAVARADLRRLADSVRVADSVKAVTALAVAADLERRADAAEAERAVALARADSATTAQGRAATTLRATLDSAQRALLDSLEAAHRAVVSSLRQALRADSMALAALRLRGDTLETTVNQLRQSNASLAIKLREAVPRPRKTVRQALVAAACVVAGAAAGEKQWTATALAGTGCIVGSL